MRPIPYRGIATYEVYGTIHQNPTLHQQKQAPTRELDAVDGFYQASTSAAHCKEVDAGR